MAWWWLSSPLVSAGDQKRRPPKIWQFAANRDNVILRYPSFAASFQLRSEQLLLITSRFEILCRCKLLK